MAFPGSVYAPPGVYTQTLFEDPVQGIAGTVRLPLIMGVGSEILFQNSLELVRGSSSSVDPKAVQEDETGRAVVSVSTAGAVTLGAFNGSLDRIQVKNYPIVTGDGSGTTATNSSSINVTVNSKPVVILSIDGAKGILQLSVKPKVTDVVQVTYYYSRTDTLITDDLSDQVSEDAPILYGAIGQNFEITTGDNDTLIITVDKVSTVTAVISESPVGGWTAAQIAAFINSSATGTTLVATSANNNFGDIVVCLTADRDISIGAGSANATLGFTTGTATSRNRIFYTFQRPIVDGSNGGITTTDPAKVTVKVDGIAVTPVSVDGLNGALTLPFAPEIGATVTATYYFNTWQDTYDNLANRNITNITLCGITPDRSDYVEGVDFILKDDLILWGTASVVEAGQHTTGSDYFNDTQVTDTLVDMQQYLAECASYGSTATQFVLPLQATTGNGRNTPITGGSATYKKVTNGRIDLPTNRPDLIFAYWGYSLADALERGRVTVTKVDSDNNRITLASPVPTGATVYATFYYNTVQDQEYTLSVGTPGASGVGTYTIQDQNGNYLYSPTYGTKSASLATVAIQFPSGSERAPDCRFETPFTATDFTGAVEEDVTITFASQDATLAKFAVAGASPYYMVSGASDQLALNIDNAGVVTYNLSDPSGSGAGFAAYYTGSEVVYDASSGYTTFEIDSTNNTVDLEIDGVLIQAVANAGAENTIAEFQNAINRASFGEFQNATGGSASTVTLPASASDTADYYAGWIIKMTTGSAVGDKRTVASYDESTKTLTVTSNFSGSVGSGDSYQLYDPTVLPKMRGTTRFLSGVDLSNGFYVLKFRYVGNITGTSEFTAYINDVSYPSATALVTAVQTAINNAIITAGFRDPTSTTAEMEIFVSVDSSGRLVLSLVSHPEDTEFGFLELGTSGTPANDFAILAGFDIDVAGGNQTKLWSTSLARSVSFTGPTTGQKRYDRLILRNRIVPGLAAQAALDQCQLKILGGTGATLSGLKANDIGKAGLKATMLPPTLYSEVGLSGGQASGTGQPIVTFYASGGTTAQNNIFKMTFEGTPLTVTFKDGSGATIPSGGSADVPLGPLSNANSVLGQINAALVSAGISSGVLQEGAGIRFRGSLSTVAASLVIGTGNANRILGFTDGATAYRTTLAVETLVSGLMSNSDFTDVALAKAVADNSNAKYLFVQSLGTAGAGFASAVEFNSAAMASALLPGTGLGVIDGAGNTGEDAIDGFYVVSSDPVNGSGSINTSILNGGTGQDGTVGQTYRDLTTGLTFTVLSRSGGVSYPAGSYFTIKVRKNTVCNANVPINTIPGLQLTVSNTLNLAVGDTAIVTTYNRGGSQPAVGDLYYVSYQYQKTDFATSMFTKMSTIEAAYGQNNPQNPVTLASYLAITNGAVMVAIKQVQKDEDINADGIADTASLASYETALEEIEGPIPGGVYPDYIIPLKGDSLTLLQAVARHCDLQSSIRLQAERTAIVGYSAGTEPNDAGSQAQAIGRTRLRAVYPDLYTLSLTKADGVSETYLVDGTYMAAAVAGSRALPSIDVATPWTGTQILGFKDIARVLDPVQQNQIATRGVTVMALQDNQIKIRHGLTTDMTNNLTKIPTVVQIADEVQRQTRTALRRFVGTKFFRGVTGQMEGQLSATLQKLQAAQIIAGYKGVSAKVSEDDPTAAEIEAYYQPIFPLLYIITTFSVRSSL